MAESAPPAKKGCLRRGCFGCLIVAGAGLGLILVLALITGSASDIRSANSVWVSAGPGKTIPM